MKLEIEPSPLTVKPARVAELAIGFLGNWVMVYSFDFFLYPFVIWKLGLLLGGIVMSILSLLVCLLTIWLYDWSKRDWLGIELNPEFAALAVQRIAERRNGPQSTTHDAGQRAA